MKNNVSIQLTPQTVLNTLKRLLSDENGLLRVEAKYADVIAEVIDAMSKEYECETDSHLEELMRSVHAKEITKGKLLEEHDEKYSAFKAEADEKVKATLKREMDQINRKIETIDLAIVKLDSKIEKEQNKEFKFTSKAAKEIFNTLVTMCEIDYAITQFRSKRIFSFSVVLAGDEKKTYTSTNPTAFINYFTGCDQRVYPYVLRIVTAMLKDYPLDGEAGHVFASANPTARSEAIEQFARGIDAQCGKGAFAAYYLYPEIYDYRLFKIKRSFVLGTRPSTGKTLMMNIARMLYGPLAKVTASRPTESDSGYNKGVLDWNRANKDAVILLIDDDKEDGRSREDFYKNIYMHDGLEIGHTRKANEYATFEGNIFANVNTLDPSFKAEQIQKRIYFLHLTVRADEYLTSEQLAEIVDYNEESDSSALVNYLNAHREDAKEWLKNYKTPEVLDEKTKAEREKEALDRSVLEFIDSTLVANDSGKMMLSTLAKAFAGEVRITQRYVNELGKGYFVAKVMRFTDKHTGKSTTFRGITTTKEADLGKVEHPLVKENAEFFEAMKKAEAEATKKAEDAEKVDVLDVLLKNIKEAETLPDVATIDAPDVKAIDKADVFDAFVEASDKRMKESITIEASDTVKLFANVKQIENTELTAVKVGAVVAVFADETTDEKKVGTYLSEISGRTIEAVDSVEVNADTVVTLINNGQTVDDTTEKATGVDFERITSFAYAVEKLEGVVVATTSSNDTPG